MFPGFSLWLHHFGSTFTLQAPPRQPAPTSADLLAEERELLATWLGMRTMELHVPFCINLYDDLYDKYMRTVWEIYGDIWEIPSGKRENN